MSAFSWLNGFSFDMKLGLRMLRKYPGLTIVGGLAMAFAIWVATVTFQVLALIVSPTLPLPGGDRVVQVANWDLEAGDTDPRSLHDFIAWREALTSITDLGAYRDVTRNLVTSDGAARTVGVAEITATAFRIAPTPPLMGRAIVAADEQAGAPPVVVLGYELWQARFAGDRGVIGRSVNLGDVPATVVGVMPKGFGFPIAHEMWTQLRPDLLSPTPRGGPGIKVFGRLAAGFTMEKAQAELATLGRRAAAAYPATHQRLEPRVAPYAEGFSGPSFTDLSIFASIYLFVLMLLVLVCSNVALLLFARAATRETELVVRTAMGADRGRIVLQLFAEALVLGGVASVVGLAAAHFALGTWVAEFLRTNLGQVPFWYDLGLAPATVAWALGLTLLSAAIAGILPALKITRGLGARLRQGTAGGGGVQFGGVWTAVIIAQVAATVAFPSVVFVIQREGRRIASFDVGFPAKEYLGVRLDLDVEPGAGGDAKAVEAAQSVRYGAALEELRRRVAAEPEVAGVTFVDRLPRMPHREGYVEGDFGKSAAGTTQRDSATSAVSTALHEVSYAMIDPSYFAVLEAPILAGRAFDAGDVSPNSRVVIVDQSFVDQVLQGRNAVGRLVRFVELRRDGTRGEVQPWFEIVGVVKDLGMTYVASQHRAAGVYLPASLVRVGDFHMVVHAPADPMALATRVRELAAAVDPVLKLSDLQRVDQVADPMLWISRMWLRASVLLTAVALLLSLAGIYAVLSFTVSRRRREIGVRVALGASRQRVVAGIFRRPLTNVAVGVLAGGTLIALMAFAVSGGDGGLGRVEGGFSIANVALLVLYAAIMFGVCLLACVVPTRRALKVEPTEAMRAE